MVERIVNGGKGGFCGGFVDGERGGEVGFEEAFWMEEEVRFIMRRHHDARSHAMGSRDQFLGCDSKRNPESQKDRELDIDVESREADGGTKICGPEWKLTS